MKQQFFVGDSVRICDTPQESTHVDWTDLMDGYAGDIGTVTEVSEYHRSGRLGYVVDDGYYFDAKWLTIVERAWQKNTGKQPVEDGVEVEVKFRSCGKDKLFAGQFRWDFQDSIGDIVEWRIADSISSNKEQPEAIPPSHVALEDNLVQVGGPYMKIWCDTCQGTGEIDETLGGESFSSRDTPCPDCDGNGWWERLVNASVDNAPVQQDLVNSPKHYAFFDGVEAIEIIASSMSVEAFRGYCMGNALKYRLRVGKKDKVEQEIAKADKYGELFEKHKHLCKGVW